MTITVEEFLKKAEESAKKDVKKIQLSFGEVEIKKILSRELQKATGHLNLLNSANIKTVEESGKVDPNKMDINKLYEYNDILICLAVNDPKITRTNEPNAIPLNKISDEDYKLLILEITDFSIARRQDLEPFRKGKPASSPRRYSKKIRKNSK